MYISELPRYVSPLVSTLPRAYVNEKTIAELEYKIKLQELVVAERKALLDAYLAEDETEEDTEVEEDTEAEA